MSTDIPRLPASFDTDRAREPDELAEVIDLETEAAPCEPGGCEGHTEYETGFGGSDRTVYCDQESTDRIMAAHEARTRQPVNPELFARTAPAWNCISDPSGPHNMGGPHYTAGDDCSWCGATPEEIAKEYEAGE